MKTDTNRVGLLETRYKRSRTQRKRPHTLTGGNIKASEVLDCPLKLRRHFDGVQPTDFDELETDVVIKLQEGNLHERDVIEQLNKAGYSITRRDEWSKQYIAGIKVTGRIDLHISGQRINEKSIEGIMDVKTLATFKGERLPKWKAVKQIMYYSMSDGAEHGYLFYKDRSNGQVRAYRVAVTEEFKQLVTENLTKVSEVDSHEHLEPVKLVECGWCRYRSMCWGNDGN